MMNNNMMNNMMNNNNNNNINNNLNNNINNNLNNMNNNKNIMNNIPDNKMNNPNPNPIPSDNSTTFKQIEFRFIDQAKGDDIKVMVHSQSNMTVQKLITNFRNKLCDDSIVIKQYLLNDQITLSPNSTDTIEKYGIDENSKIKAIK